MLFGLGVLNDLWTGIAHSFGGELAYKKVPLGYWFGVFIIFFMGVIMMFVLGSGWFKDIHWASH